MSEVDKDDEAFFLSPMERIILRGNDIQRKQLLSRIVVLLFTRESFACDFVAAGGISLLVIATRDSLEKVRLHSLHALCRLVEMGYGPEIASAGAKKDLQRMCSDPYLPIRKLAGKCLSRI